MRITYILTQDLESPGGLGRYWPLAREMARLGHKVAIIALHSNYQSLEQKRFMREGVDIWYVAPMHVRKYENVKSYYSTPKLIWVVLRATFALCWAALFTPADIVHIGKPQPMNSIAGLLTKYLRRNKLLLDCDDIEEESGHFTSLWQKKTISFFERKTPLGVDLVTTHSTAISRRLIKFGVREEKIYFLFNGFDSLRFRPPTPESLEEMRLKFGLFGKKVVAYIGTLGKSGHAVDLLLNAFVNVKEAIPNSVLMLVGGGEDFELLKHQSQVLGIDDRVIFTGRVKPNDVVLYYYLADVTVDPVKDEEAARGRLPLKMFESWGCGVPFVTCDIGDRRTWIGRSEAGLLALPGSAESLAGMIINVLTDPKMADCLRENGLERVKSFDWQNLAIQMEKQYKALIG